MLLIVRWLARRRRRYVRLRVAAYRIDAASAEAIVSLYAALHRLLLERWWRRIWLGQPAVSLEIHYEHSTPRARAAGARASFAWLAVGCPRDRVAMVESALRVAYANCALRPTEWTVEPADCVLRLKKAREFIRRVKSLDRFEHERDPPVNRLLTAMAAGGESSCVQLALTPAPSSFERFARRVYRSHEARISRERRAHAAIRDRSLLEDVELRGGLDVQHRPLFFAELRILARRRQTCERVASALRADSAENRLVERGTTIRHGLLGVYRRRVARGEGNPLPSLLKGVYATTELASLWHLPSVDYATVPFARDAMPLAPAPPSVYRPPEGEGTLRDALGAVSVHPEMRKQNTAVPGAVEQGKSSYLIATVAEDLRRERCAVVVLDPKGDAADAAVSLVPAERTCTLLDFAQPTCGFNPLAVDAPADVIADYVVAALKNLFTDGDIRASSDRYLRNAIIAVLAFDRRATLWDAARLLSVGEEGYAYRSAVGSADSRASRVQGDQRFLRRRADRAAGGCPQHDDGEARRAREQAREDAQLGVDQARPAQRLADGRLRPADRESRGAGRQGRARCDGRRNTSVLMQLLVGMLDSALARQQDLVSSDRRIAVALKVDEAPLVLNRGFAETMALKRSAGLETVACWQSDAQWIDRDVREQLDALFAHRVYFATASTREARSAAGLMMAEFSDTVRPRVEHLGVLGHPDARLHLPRHHAIASWATPMGRQAAFVGETIPLRVDRERIALHAARQLPARRASSGGLAPAALAARRTGGLAGARERPRPPCGRSSGAGDAAERAWRSCATGTRRAPRTAPPRRSGFPRLRSRWRRAIASSSSSISHRACAGRRPRRCLGRSIPTRSTSRCSS